MSLLPSAQPSFVMTGDGFPFTEFLPGNLGFKAPFPPECTNYEGHGLFPLCLFLKDICNCQFSGPLAPTSSLSRSHPPPQQLQGDSAKGVGASLPKFPAPFRLSPDGGGQSHVPQAEADIWTLLSTFLLFCFRTPVPVPSSRGLGLPFFTIYCLS